MAGFTLKIGADATAYKNELEKMRTQTKSFSSQIGGIMKGAFALLSVGALRDISKEFTEMSLAAQSLGVPVKEFMKLAQVTMGVGMNAEQTADAIKDLIVKTSQAASGESKGLQEFFDLMNFDYMSANKKEGLDVVFAFADALKKVPNLQDLLKNSDEINDIFVRFSLVARKGGDEMQRLMNLEKGFTEEELASLVAGEAAWAKMVMRLKLGVIPTLQLVASLVEDIGSLISGDFQAIKNKDRGTEKKTIKQRIIPLNILPQEIGRKIAESIPTDTRTSISRTALLSTPAGFPLEAIKSLKAIEENTKDKLNKPPQPEQ